jgi:hypothetical protein
LEDAAGDDPFPMSVVVKFEEVLPIVDLEQLLIPPLPVRWSVSRNANRKAIMQIQCHLEVTFHVRECINTMFENLNIFLALVKENGL